MSMIAIEEKDYSDGRTKQAFKDQTDINKIIAKAQKTGTLSHLARHGAMYGDFTDVPDLLEAHERIKRGQRVFDELPSELRKEFGNDQFRFWLYVNDPENKERVEELLPALARPGRQLPSAVRTAATELRDAVTEAFKASQTPPEPPREEEPPVPTT